MKHKKKSRWWKGKKKTQHHLIPVSRGGKDFGNIVLLSENVHKAWHVLFGNRTPEEAIAYLPILLNRWQEEAERKSWNPSLTSSRSDTSSCRSRFRSSAPSLSSST